MREKRGREVEKKNSGKKTPAIGDSLSFVSSISFSFSLLRFVFSYLDARQKLVIVAKVDQDLLFFFE